MSKGRKLLALGAVVGAFAVPQAAQAAPPASVFGGAVACAPQGAITFCGSNTPRSTAPAFDGVPIDVNVALPDEAQFGPPPYPLIMLFHGYGGGKLGLSDMQTWLNRGYATFSQTNRGFRESCGSAGSKAAAAVTKRVADLI